MSSSLHRLSLNPFRLKNMDQHNINADKNHYSEASLWRCENKRSRRVHVIHGPLAKILADYPDDYDLTYVGDEQSFMSYKKVM